jgi:hypothetical protein
MNKKLSVLEMYHKLGWLNKAIRKWSADDRLKAGIRLYNDYYLAHRGTGCINYENPRVDSSINKPESAKTIEAQVRFSQALKAIPLDFRKTVYAVVCDDKAFEEPEHIGERKKIAHKAEQATLLCLGLDRLIWHYLKGKKDE